MADAIVYDFDRSKNRSGEALIIDSLAARFRSWRVLKATSEDQRLGRDVWFEYPSGGRHSVECKGDHRARDRVFVETGSLGPSWCQSGWVYTCRADFIAYCPFAAGRIFVIPPARLREHLNAWLRAHRIGVAANRNYWTYGVLVPLATVGELASYVVPLVRARGYAS